MSDLGTRRHYHCLLSTMKMLSLHKDPCADYMGRARPHWLAEGRQVANLLPSEPQQGNNLLVSLGIPLIPIKSHPSTCSAQGSCLTYWFGVSAYTIRAGWLGWQSLAMHIYALMERDRGTKHTFLETGYLLLHKEFHGSPKLSYDGLNKKTHPSFSPRTA